SPPTVVNRLVISVESSHARNDVDDRTRSRTAPPVTTDPSRGETISSFVAAGAGGAATPRSNSPSATMGEPVRRPFPAIDTGFQRAQHLEIPRSGKAWTAIRSRSEWERMQAFLLLATAAALLPHTPPATPFYDEPGLLIPKDGTVLR